MAGLPLECYDLLLDAVACQRIKMTDEIAPIPGTPDAVSRAEARPDPDLFFDAVDFTAAPVPAWVTRGSATPRAVVIDAEGQAPAAGRIALVRTGPAATVRKGRPSSLWGTVLAPDRAISASDRCRAVPDTLALTVSRQPVGQPSCHSVNEGPPGKRRVLSGVGPDNTPKDRGSVEPITVVGPGAKLRHITQAWVNSLQKGGFEKAGVIGGKARNVGPIHGQRAQRRGLPHPVPIGGKRIDHRKLFVGEMTREENNLGHAQVGQAPQGEMQERPDGMGRGHHHGPGEGPVP